MVDSADLYLDKIDLGRYCPVEQCELCKVDSLDELILRIKTGRLASGVCPHWPAAKVEAFRLAVKAGEILPPTPMLDAPRPAAPGLMELAATGPGSPVLITGNSEFTQAVLLAILSLTSTPLKLLSVDTQGHTVDMALIFQAMTADRIASALLDAGVKEPYPRIILPGLAFSLMPELESTLGAQVELGPICAAELPLYLGDEWTPVN